MRVMSKARLKRRAAVAVMVAAAALGGQILSSAPAYAATYVGTYTVGSSMSPNGVWCLDANTAQGGTNGTRVQIWSCNYQAQQQWAFYRVSGDIYNIVNVRYGMCLDADLSHIQQNGDQIQLWACNGGDQQKWVMPYLGNDPPLFANISCYFNFNVIDADISKPFGNGTKVQLWWPDTYPAGANQLWAADWVSG